MPKRAVIILGILFSAAAFIMRLIPHPWNFTPMGALALWSGFILPRRWLPLPLVALFLSDLIIGTYDIKIMSVVYGSYLVVIFFSRTLRSYYSWPTVFTSSLAGSLLFFFSTNAGVWLWSGMYEPGLSGLAASYLAGIPFFRHTLLGDLFYSGIFFASYELLFISSSFLAGSDRRASKRFPVSPPY